MTYEEILTKAKSIIFSYWADQEKVIPMWLHSPKRIFDRVVLVMTGGEPLLQENINDFLLVAGTTMFGRTQIESNGIPETPIPDFVTLVCSPKCAEKDGKATKYFKPSKTILERADCLKFVMSADPDSPYYTVPDWAHSWALETGNPIYCSPMNIYNDFPQKIKLLRAEKGVITMAERSTVDEVINFFEPGLLNMEKVRANHEYVGKYCMEHGFKMNMQMHLFANLA
jgi:organic radical activating enzyme